MQSLEGLIDAIELAGRSDMADRAAAIEARAASALGDGSLPAAARLTWELVRTHALAARHATDESLALMRKVRAEQGTSRFEDSSGIAVRRRRSRRGCRSKRTNPTGKGGDHAAGRRRLDSIGIAHPVGRGRLLIRSSR